MKTRVAALGAVVVVGLAGFASAKTVALWPVEYDIGRNGWNPFGQANAVDGSYPLCLINVNTGISTEDVTTGWELPPNPDPSVPVERARNGRAAAGLAGDANQPVLCTENLGADYLTRDKDYTVELYMKLLDLPTGGGWYYLFGALNKDSAASADKQDGNNRWMATFRHDKDKNVYYWNFYSAGGNVGDRRLLDLTVDEAAALTNVWHHLAFTHCAKNATSQKEEWALYLDGQQIGSTFKCSPLASIVTPIAHSFEVGGRFAGNRASAAWDYIRVSDTVLTPSEFLCADNPNATKGSSTIAYWKFDVGADGKPDLSPSVGKAELSALVGIGDPTNMVDSIMVPCPNVQAPTGIAGNNGCVYGRTALRSYLCHMTAGDELTLLNDFTAEGWFKQSVGDYAADATRVLFSTRDKSQSGWTLFFTKSAQFGSNDTYGFYVAVNSDAGSRNLYFKNAPDLVGWNDWKHVALVYKANEGNGTWRVYLDGVLYGTVEDTVKPSYAKVPSFPFLIGGRHTDVKSWGGWIDYVRICKAALEPSQFLRSNGGATATNVLATWPLDVQDGFFFNGHDISGNNLHLDRNFMDRYPDTSDKYIPQAKADDAPTITNPDRTIGFRGDPADKNGSVQFWDAVNNNTRPGRCSYVGTRDRDFIGAMTNRQPLTVEMFVKRTCDASACDKTQWEHLFAWYGHMGVYTGKSGGTVLIRYDPTNGFQVNDGAWMKSSGDTSFNDKGAVEPKGEWRHYAFVRTFEGDDLVWTLYINGTKEGEVRKEARATVALGSPNFSVFYIGGRGHGDITAFKGRVGTVRVSRAALTPADFLCAAKQQSSIVPSPEVLAVWPLNFNGTAIDAGNAVGAGYGLALDNATGSRARKGGSVDFTEGGAVAPDLGLYATMFRPFTVEGYVKNPSGPVVGTWDDTTQGGWRLTAKGDGTFELVGRANFRGTYYLEGSFDARAVAWNDLWHHLALRYDPTVGAEGTWTLFVDAKEIGTAVNLSRPEDFALMVPRNLSLAGGYDERYDGWRTAPRALTAPFTGSLDNWRFTQKALTAEELSYVEPQGLMLLVR